MNPDDLIYKLNRIIRGWGQYFRYGWVSNLFNKLDFYIHSRFGGWLKKKFKSHVRGKRKGPRVGTWKWIYKRFTSREVTGRWRWNGGKHVLIRLRTVCPPIKLLHLPSKVPTLFKSKPLTKQSRFLLNKIGTGLGTILGMESSVQRHRNW